ncbi:MAG: DUF885 domain-containing protein, partial [Planctomycetaceae bacterium]|nr:DUF885 domain-containing protein [Planctomycetaceae bacterium]
PTFASELGDLRYNDLWDDASVGAIERSHQADRAALDRLDQIDRTKLSAADQLNYDVFRSEYALRVEQHRFRWWLVPLNQRGGIQDAGSLADSLSFDSVKDYEDWLARMRAFPEHMAQTLLLLRTGARERIIHPRIVLERIPSQIARQIVDDPESQLFYKPFRSMPDDIPAETAERLRSAARELIVTAIVPAYRDLQKFFDDEYLPAGLPEVGLWQTPDGAAHYAARCREFTTTQLTPAEIHQIGLDEVRRIRAEMEAVVREVGFAGTFQEFLEELRTNPQFYFQDPNELLVAYQAICKSIDPQLVKLFRRLPRIPYGVEAIPEHIAPDTTTAYYRPPAADGSRAGTFFVNLYRPDVRPKYEMEALTLHEAVPGHHLQIALAQELESLPEFRRYGGYTAYVEGWALYAESLGGELGLYRDPYSRFGQLTYEMWRAVRLVIDTGMHAFHWTRDRSIEFFAENTAKTRHDIENEVDRYIAWPGQALAYKIGELRIRELRRRAESELGEKFDLREFHQVVLQEGAVPLDALEMLVEQWIATRQAAP